LTFWPPGPEEWMKRSDNSLSGMTRRVLMTSFVR
jgi:hypothetical protein